MFENCCCRYLVWLAQNTKKMVLRESPSREHKLAWDRFDQIRKKMSNLIHLFSAVRTISSIALEDFECQKSAKFMATTSKEFNKDLVEQIFPYLEAILYIMVFARLLLVVCYLKYSRFSSIYFLYYMVYKALILTLPRDHGDYLIELAV